MAPRFDEICCHGLLAVRGSGFWARHMFIASLIYVAWMVLEWLMASMFPWCMLFARPVVFSVSSQRDSCEPTVALLRVISQAAETPVYEQYALIEGQCVFALPLSGENCPEVCSPGMSKVSLKVSWEMQMKTMSQPRP